MSLTMTVYGPTKPLHDGHYRSWAPSPSVMIANLIASLRDVDGHILIPHFYDDVAPVSAADKAALAAMPPVENMMERALGLGRNVGPARLADASFDFRLAPGKTREHTRELLENYLTQQGWFIDQHAQNENPRLGNLWDEIEVYTGLLTDPSW